MKGMRRGIQFGAIRTPRGKKRVWKKEGKVRAGEGSRTVNPIRSSGSNPKEVKVSCPGRQSISSTIGRGTQRKEA